MLFNKLRLVSGFALALETSPQQTFAQTKPLIHFGSDDSIIILALKTRTEEEEEEEDGEELIA